MYMTNSIAEQWWYVAMYAMCCMNVPLFLDIMNELLFLGREGIKKLP
jgi:hypothetical protein